MTVTLLTRCLWSQKGRVFQPKQFAMTIFLKRVLDKYDYIFVWQDAILDIAGHMNRYPMKCDVTVPFSVQCSTAPSKSASVGPKKRGTFWLSFKFDILNLILHLRITGEFTKDSMTTMQLKRYWLLWYFYVAPAISSVMSQSSIQLWGLLRSLSCFHQALSKSTGFVAGKLVLDWRE